MSYLFFNIPHLLATYGYLGVFAIVFLESGIFFPLPGDSLLFTAGVFATSVNMKIHILIILTFVATFLGGLAGYVIGVYIERLHSYAFFRKILRRNHIDSAHEFFEKHGKLAVILSRFVPIVRTFAPIVAGIARMNLVKFIQYSLISSILWTSSMTLAGYLLGMQFPNLHKYISYIVILVILFSVVPLVLEWYRRKLKLQSQTI